MNENDQAKRSRVKRIILVALVAAAPVLLMVAAFSTLLRSR